MTAPKAPTGLGKSGRAQWRSIAGSYKLRPDELTVLEDVCRTGDMITALTKAWDLAKAWDESDSPTTTTGSMGQLVIHPLIPEIARHRAARAALLRQLKLPDADETPVPNQHRTAAQTKWSARGA